MDPGNQIMDPRTDPRMRTLDIRPHGAVRHQQYADRSGKSKAFDKTIGKISDRTKVIAVKVTGSDVKDLDIAIIKATNHNKVPPKEKHVRTLVEAVKFGNRFTTDHILKTLPKRPQDVKKWLIALKSCIAYHRLIRETNGIFIDQASSSGYMGLQLGLFKDTFTNTSWDFSAFIREYSRYLEKMIRVHQITGYFPEQEAFGTSSKFRNIELPDLLTHMPQLSMLMEEATSCLPERSAVNSQLVQIAVQLILRECTMMYKSSEEAMMNVVDKYFALEPEEASQVLVVYKANIVAKEKLVQFMGVCKASGLSQGMNIPSGLQGVPEDFMKSMEDHAAGIKEESEEIPPIIEVPESPEKVDTPRPETPPPPPEPESPPPPPEPVIVPDLMCLDSPMGNTEDLPPAPVEEEDDELTSLWKGGAPAESAPSPNQNPFGQNQFAQSSSTGFIATNTFVAGPTGMLGGAQSNNPFLMPVAPAPVAAPPPATYGPGGTANKVTNVLGDLGLEHLGIRKAPAQSVSTEPMRKPATQLRLEYQAPPGPLSPNASHPSPQTSLQSPSNSVPQPPLVPSTPFYNVHNPQQYGQQYTGFPPQQYHGGPTGYQASHTGGYQPPPQGYQNGGFNHSHSQPSMQPQYSGGATGYNQYMGNPGHPPQQFQGGAPANYGAAATGAPHPSQYGNGMAPAPAQGFTSAATGPANGSNPFGGNAFGGDAAW